MSQQHQQQQQQLLIHQPQSEASPDAMAQLAAQVHSHVGTMVTSGPVQGSIMVNPNVPGNQVIPPAGQVQNVTGYQPIPVMWNPHQQMLAPSQPSQNFAPPLLPQQQQTSAGQYVGQYAGESQSLSSSNMILNNNLQTTVSSLPPSSAFQEALAGPVPIPDGTRGKTSEPISDRTGKKRKIAQGGKGSRASKAALTIGGNDSQCSYEADGPKTQLNRERNREHARSTRLRKKAYIQKLKDMANGLRTVQTEEIRQRRIATQRMLEVQHVRRTVLQTALAYHVNFESDPAKWNHLLEDTFWMKEPVTPFRSFRRSQVERDCRIVRGVDAMICDAASMSVMIERVGCHNARWRRIKRSDFIGHGDDDAFGKKIDESQHPESSLSGESGSDSSRSSSSNSKKRVSQQLFQAGASNSRTAAKKAISSSDSSTGTFGTEFRDGSSSNHGCGDAISYSQVTASHESSKVGIADPLVMRPKIGSGQQQYADIVPSNAALSNPPSSMVINSGILSSAALQLVNTEEIHAIYAINEDDMVMIEDVMMCPFVFRTRNAVVCGALSDCVMPGMLRAQFSTVNKLMSLEMVFDAMGFMQQLDGANGGEVTAQVIPGSLEMALMHSPHEARVITEAKPPFCVLHVNEPWTRLTQYTQLEVEGKPLLSLLEGDDTDPNAGRRSGKPVHNLNEVAKGRSACSTNLHYGKLGKSFVDFMCSYPLTNSTDEITHLLHVNMELPKIGLY